MPQHAPHRAAAGRPRPSAWVKTGRAVRESGSASTSTLLCCARPQGASYPTRASGARWSTRSLQSPSAHASLAYSKPRSLQSSWGGLNSPARGNWLVGQGRQETCLGWFALSACDVTTCREAGQEPGGAKAGKFLHSAAKVGSRAEGGKRGFGFRGARMSADRRRDLATCDHLRHLWPRAWGSRAFGRHR